MKYSIIIPVYNKNDTIQDAVKSILAQKCEHEDFEVLIVDDGSTIPVSNTFKHYKDDRIKNIRKKNGGVSSARNVGIQAAHGDYICFLDADDVWLPNHISELDRLIKKYGKVPMLVTAHIEQLMDGTVRHHGDIMSGKEHDFITNNLFDLLIRYSGGIIHTNSVCINRNVFLEENILFEDGAIRGEDTDVWFRVALSHDIIFSREETTVYRRELSTATKNTSFIYSWIFSERLPDILKRKDINEDLKKSCVRFLDRYWMTCVRESRFDGERQRARQYLKKISEHNTIRFLVTIVIAYLPDEIFRKLYVLLMRR